MKEIEFIPVKPNELETVKMMATDIWNAHYSSILSKEQINYMLKMMYEPAVIQKEIGNGIHWKFIRFEDENTGFLSYHHEQDKNQIKLSKLYVYPKFHGKGIGNAALNYVIEEAIKLRALQVYLTVNKQNTKAISAYLRAGFINSKSVVSDIGNGFVMDDYIMVYKID